MMDSNWKSTPWALACLSALMAMLLQPARASAAEPARATVSVNWILHYHDCDSLSSTNGMTRLSRGEDVFLFSPNSRRIEFNGIAIWLSEPVREKWGRPRILKTDVNKTILPLLHPGRFMAEQGCSVVVLDAGHGGKDKGATDYQGEIEEKMITIRLANMARDILEENGVTVRMTRNRDEWISLDERSEVAAGYGADLFVSIHLNGATNTAATGVETHVLPPAGMPSIGMPTPNGKGDPAHPGNNHDGANLILGHALQHSLVKRSGSFDRGVRRSRFQVLRNAPCPAALVECGFLTNRDEADKFKDAAYCERIAGAIADGILFYIESVQQARIENSNDLSQ